MAEEQGQPMDPSAREGDGVMHVNHPRMTYGMETLVAEVLALFPETTYETSNVNPRNVAFDVQFDITSFGADPHEVATLIGLTEDDERIFEVSANQTHVLVSFVNNPTLMDNRDPYGLADAWIVLNEGEVQ